MKAAIYSRKSKFTGKGDSIENQIQLCIQYLNHHQIYDYVIYEDEGYSGKNIQRPQFLRLLEDAQKKQFDLLICYRLDRVSRNIADFSNLIEKLQKHSIDFISIKEQFDTSTPMGRAMMNIAAVFAQLERETIAERIRDNMLELAKSGRWLGGQTPLGYGSKKIHHKDDFLKEHTLYQLYPLDHEVKIIQIIFKSYLKTKSLLKVHKYLLSHSIKGKNGGQLGKKSLQSILKNPVYVKADNEVFSYLKNLGMYTTGHPNKKFGILTYNKNQNGKKQDLSEWIAAIGKHPGIIDAKDWLDVQSILKSNKIQSPRIHTSHTALLTNLLKCHQCGSPMRIIYGSKNKYTGKKIYYYTCSRKNQLGKIKCDNPNVRGDLLEHMIIKHLKQLDPFILVQELKKMKKNLSIDPLDHLKKELSFNQQKIYQLVKQISMHPKSSAVHYLIKEIEQLDCKNEKLKEKIHDYISCTCTPCSYSKSSLMDIFDDFNKWFFSLKSVEDQRFLMNHFVKKITWDGHLGRVDVFLYESPNS